MPRNACRVPRSIEEVYRIQQQQRRRQTTSRNTILFMSTTKISSSLSSSYSINNNNNNNNENESRPQASPTSVSSTTTTTTTGTKAKPLKKSTPSKNKKSPIKSTKPKTKKNRYMTNNNNKNNDDYYTWEDRIQQLQSFRDTYGHVKVQTTIHEMKYPGLSTWIRQVRRMYMNVNTTLLLLDEETAIRISSMTNHPDENDLHDRNRTKELLKYQKKMEKLQQFLDIVHGNATTSTTTTDTGTSTLATKMTSITTTSTTTTAFVWNVQEHSWKVRYEQLLEFHQRHNHCRVPNNDVQYPGLGIWVRNQRREYQKLLLIQQQQQPSEPIHNLEQPVTNVTTKSTLTPERLQLLQQLNFEWYKSHSTAWEQQYQRLLQFYHTYHHTNVPQNYSENDNDNTDPNRKTPPSLGKWCMNQRTAYKNQKRLLNQYNNSSSSSNNNTNVTVSSSSSSSTMTTIPTSTGSNALTPERIQLLEAIHFQWNIKSMKWKTMLQRLRLYYDAHHQSVVIPVNDTMNTDLRIWMNLQRYYYHNTITANKNSNTTTTTTTSTTTPTTTANMRRGVSRRPLPVRTLSASRIQRMERTIPNFQWTIRGSKNNGPSSEDWFLLFEEMRKKGIGPNVRPKQHWFEGINIQNIPIKDTPYTEQELLALWNQEDDDDDDE